MSRAQQHQVELQQLDPLVAPGALPEVALPPAGVVAPIPRTDETARRAIQGISLPSGMLSHPAMEHMHPMGELPVITAPPKNASKVNDVATSRRVAANKAAAQSPVGLEVAKTFLEIEANSKKKMREIRQSIEKSKAKMDGLLDVSAKTQTFSSDKDSHDISPELRAALDRLRNDHGIELISANATRITKEQLVLMRDHIKSHLDTTKTTEISTKFLDNEMLMSNLKALGDIVQAMIRRSEQADRQALQHMAQNK